MTQSARYLINGESITGLSPLDRGLAYGDGVFRTLRVRQGVPLGWSFHYHKLERDCSALGIVCPSEHSLLTDIAILCDEYAESVAKIVVTRGIGLRGYATASVDSPTRIVIVERFQDYPQANYAEGVTLHLCSLRLSHQPRLAGIKHLNRLENVLARSEWSGSDFADGRCLIRTTWSSNAP